jgi:cellulose synthase/poly-beta-1,6-N-acetylglucosamine synthase-like glycosyltransferase
MVLVEEGNIFSFIEEIRKFYEKNESSLSCSQNPALFLILSHVYADNGYYLLLLTSIWILSYVFNVVILLELSSPKPYAFMFSPKRDIRLPLLIWPP